MLFKLAEIIELIDLLWQSHFPGAREDSNFLIFLCDTVEVLDPFELRFGDV